MKTNPLDVSHSFIIVAVPIRHSPIITLSAP